MIIISICKLLASAGYTTRQNTAVKILHQAIACTYTTQTILENKYYSLAQQTWQHCKI